MLELAILGLLLQSPMHGYELRKRLTGLLGAFRAFSYGSLYPALHRLEQQGWIRAKWQVTETGRDAKFYSLTRAGQTHLKRELANWDRLSTAVNLVVRPT